MQRPLPLSVYHNSTVITRCDTLGTHVRLVLRRKLKISTEVKNSSPLMTEAFFSVSLERIVESRENSSVKKGFPNHIFSGCLRLMVVR